jgi:SHS2 domain-containing protein
VEVRAPDRESLLIDWINELVYRCEVERVVPAAIESMEITAAEDTSIELLARARIRVATVTGPRLGLGEARLEAGRIEERPGGLAAKVIVDRAMPMPSESAVPF